MRRLSSRRIRGSIYSRPSSNPFRLARPSYTPIEFTSRYTPIEGLGAFSIDEISEMSNNLRKVPTGALEALASQIHAEREKSTGAKELALNALYSRIMDELDRRKGSKTSPLVYVGIAGAVAVTAWLLLKK